MAISIWHGYHNAMSYSASSGMFVDVMPLCNHRSYIIFLRFIGGNAVLSDKMSFFISSSALIFSEMKRLLSILFSVDERMVILDSYVNDITFYHTLWQKESRTVFVRIGCVFQSTNVSVSCRVRNGCTVMSEITVQSINKKIQCELKWKKISSRVCSFSVQSI